jgi:hypothetical protein
LVVIRLVTLEIAVVELSRRGFVDDHAAQESADSNMEDATDDPLAGIACPNCGLHKIRPSYPRGIDRLLRWFGLHPFRCRGCRGRFHRPWPLPPEYRDHDPDEDE